MLSTYTHSRADLIQSHTHLYAKNPQINYLQADPLR